MPSFPQLRSGGSRGSLGDPPVGAPLDGWGPDTDIPDTHWRKASKYSLAALIVVSVLGDIPRAEAVTLDRWQPEYPDTRLERAKRPLWIDQSTADSWLAHNPVAETVTSDKWQPTYPIRLDSAKRVLWQGWSVNDPRALTQPETPTLDKWLGEFPDGRLDRAKRAFWDGQSVLDATALTQPETPSLDKWSPKYPDGRLDRQRRPFWDGQFAVDPTALATAETAQLDKWLPTYPNRLDPVRKPFWNGQWVTDSRALAQPETITPDKWSPTYPNRLDRAKRSFWTDYTVADANLGTAPGVETVTIDKWWAETQRPPRDRVRNQYLYPHFQIDPFALTRGEAISMDKWFAETQLPPMGHRRIRTAHLLPVVMSWNPAPPAPPPPPTNVATLALLGVGF